MKRQLLVAGGWQLAENRRFFVFCDELGIKRMIESVTGHRLPAAGKRWRIFWV
ncbi:MAG TPA: hypothetical protein VE912_23205 [Bacteroidales bacterium]|nr:hypothetical protein [Bacteroidales bacterium]